jgi:hypothetical protein
MARPASTYRSAIEGPAHKGGVVEHARVAAKRHLDIDDGADDEVARYNAREPRRKP